MSSTGTETVTGAHSNSAVAEPSTRALSPKIRQNKDTGCQASFVVTIPTTICYASPSAGPGSDSLVYRDNPAFAAACPLLRPACPVLAAAVDGIRHPSGTVRCAPAPGRLHSSSPRKWVLRPMAADRPDDQGGV
ncbi:hypothetical protein GCM10020367_64080 [Streptomyces sannanensis]|uniref:Uncharacterized protein n=1 Tax=Streptomyces sannanensis TaxID=285536 RepID=A0ABP6S4H4_9ACTN